MKKITKFVILVSTTLLSACDISDIGGVFQNYSLRVEDKKTTYQIGQIYDDYVDNGGLSVKLFNTSKEKVLNKSEYSYTVKTSNGFPYDSSKAFEETGVYKVNVKKDSYPESELSILVTEKSPETITLSETSLTIAPGEVRTLTATIAPSNEFGEDDIVWASSNKGVATVSGGRVIGVKAGTARITAKIGIKSASCEVKVVTPSAPVKITSITLNATTKDLMVDETFDLIATILPENATNKGLTWTSSSTSIATVDENGTVLAKARGTTTIRATAKDGSGKYATCTIDVSDGTIPVESVSLNATSKAVTVGDSFTLTPTILPSNATDKSVTWTTNNSIIATVSTSGLVTTKAVGSVVITATSKYDSSKKATCNVTVATKVISITNISLNASTKTINVGSSTTLTATITPNNATDKSITWTSSDNSVATVSSNGLVTGIKAGTSVITAASSSNQNIKASCTVTVTNVSVTSVSLDKTTANLVVGNTVSLVPTISPSNATNKNVTWTSSNTSVATVSNGTVTALSTGSSTITVKTVDGNKTATCVVTVTSAPTYSSEWTVLIYMCGSDLESDYADTYDSGERVYGCATEDLKEIQSVKNQPNDVNIVIQAGGASKWDSYYSSVISSRYANRFHIKNGSYVKDAQITKSNMGASSTLQSFLEWGLQTSPANNIGLILWNHGGAMEGVCCDEQYSNDSLTSDEVYNAITKAKANKNYAQNFQFIGYDACLMQVQDVASLNAEYANYQVGSEESEWGYGWSYDKWVDDLYRKSPTTTILKACVDGFYQDTESAYADWGDPNDQTLSYLDLSKWSAYQTAWEDMSTYLSSNVLTSSTQWTTFKNCVNSAVKYGYDRTANSYNKGYRFDVFDVGSFITKANTTYKTNSTLITKLNAVNEALKNLVVYEKHGSAATGSTGLMFFCPIGGYNSKTGEYSTNMTRLSKWQELVYKYGNWY